MPVPTTATAAAPGHKGPSAAQRLAALQAARKRTADRMANTPAVVEVAPPTALPSRSTPSVTTVALAAADEGPMKPAFKEALLAAQEDFELQAPRPMSSGTYVLSSARRCKKCALTTGNTFDRMK